MVVTASAAQRTAITITDTVLKPWEDCAAAGAASETAESLSVSDAVSLSALVSADVSDTVSSEDASVSSAASRRLSLSLVNRVSVGRLGSNILAVLAEIICNSHKIA